MKNYRLIFLFIFAIFLSFTSCDKDDTPDGPPPTSLDVVTTLTAKPGEDINFTGTFNDEYGLTQITIDYAHYLKSPLTPQFLPLFL